MLQPLLIGLLFLSALAYVARLIWRAFAPPAAGAGAGCAKGCGACGASDGIAQRLAQAERQAQRGH